MANKVKNSKALDAAKDKKMPPSSKKKVAPKKGAKKGGKC